MMLTPSYTAGAQPTDYPWNPIDWNRSAQQKLKAEGRISGLRGRPLLALAIGHGEFIFRRQNSLNLYDVLFGNLIEAFWAALIDRRYLKLVSKEDRYNALKFNLIAESTPLLQDIRTAENIRNRDIGPKWIAVGHLLSAVDSMTRNRTPQMELIYLSNLVGQILGKDPEGSFRKWRDKIMHRFEGKDSAASHSYFWLQEDDFKLPEAQRNLLGPILPSQVIDPEETFTSEVASIWAREFFEGLNSQSNPFLTPAEDLLKLGIEKPYQLI